MREAFGQITLSRHQVVRQTSDRQCAIVYDSIGGSGLPHTEGRNCRNLQRSFLRFDARMEMNTGAEGRSAGQRGLRLVILRSLNSW